MIKGDFDSRQKLNELALKTFCEESRVNQRIHGCSHMLAYASWLGALVSFGQAFPVIQPVDL